MAPNQGYMSNDPAAAGANHVQEDRGIPQVGRKGGANRALIAVLMLSLFFIVLALAGFVVYNKLHDSKPKNKTSLVAQSTLPTLTEDAFNKNNTPPPPPPGVDPKSAVAATSPAGGTPAPMQPQQLTPEQKAAIDMAERRKRAPVLAFSQSLATQQGGSGGNPQSSDAVAENGRGTLGSALQATRMSDVAARTLADPDMTITQGTFIDCTLQTAIDSTLPGMTSCVLPRDVYSTNGHVLLLERGSKVVGQYQSGQIKSGMRRIFMLWTRIETPNGVLINLDSPATDELGRSGVDGSINNHFFLRFGSAMLVSLVDDLAQYAAQSQQSGGATTNNISFGNTAQASNDSAAIIVQNTVNIPPTLTKIQGAHVGIFVARDLYFGNIYGLASVHRN